MKVFFKVLKWTGITIGSLLLLLVVAGLGFRLLGPGPKGPTGELIDINGVQMHINCSGEKNELPTVVVEAGGGMTGDFYYWLSEGLKDSLRVVRYDRAGLGYSDYSGASRDAETVARELHALLEAAGEQPPYILAGHSLGGPYIRVFAQLYPKEVTGLIFLDSSHPEQVERMDLTRRDSKKHKRAITLLSAQAVLCDLGLLSLFERINGPILAGDGLPEEINQHALDYLRNGKYVRGYVDEIKSFHDILDQAGETRNFGTLPIRVFTADAIKRDPAKAPSADADERQATWIQMHQELAQLSTDNKHIFVDANHGTLVSKKENADIICREILQLVD